MNVARTIATALAASGVGTLDETVFVGRIPAENAKKGMWRVTQLTGSETTKRVTRTAIEIGVLFGTLDDEAAYDIDEKVRTTIASLPYTDKLFAQINVSPMADMDLADSELHEAMWSVTATVINDNYTKRI